jgi:hypothetical protein
MKTRGVGADLALIAQHRGRLTGIGRRLDPLST